MYFTFDIKEFIKHFPALIAFVLAFRFFGWKLALIIFLLNLKLTS